MQLINNIRIMNNTTRSTTTGFLIFCSMMTTLSFNAFSNDCKPNASTPTPTDNSADFITDQTKREMIYSLVDLEGDKGRIYEMHYTADYKLDEVLDADINGTISLVKFIAKHLLDIIPTLEEAKLHYGAGCSAFACPDATSGDFLMGRNFDFNHIDPATKERKMIPAIAVHTAPAGGKKSVGFVDGQFVGYRSGFYTDGKSDLSLLIAAPYLILDGINEDGLAVSVLKLDGKQTIQQQPGKKTIFTSVALRMMLDRASTVKEATELLKQYNMHMDTDSTASYHFFLADATGDFAIVEYTNSDIDQHPDTMEILTGDDAMRCVTNFYRSPTMADTPHGINHSQHGLTRYERLRDTLKANGYTLTPDKAMELLRNVSQGPDDSQLSTGFTQWSEVFNLSKRELTLSILREWDKTFTFKVE